MKTTDGGVLEQGAMSKVELVGSDRIRKTYFEYTSLLHKPYLFTSSNKIYLFERCSEHEAHEQLAKNLPESIPEIYSYNEKKYEGDGSDLTPLMKKLMKRDKVSINELNVCETVMKYLNYEQLDHIAYEYITDKMKAVNLLVLYFSTLLNMIQKAHVQPNDFHAGNMLTVLNSDKSNIEKLYVIDYGWYQRFKLIDTITDNEINYGYKLDTTNSYNTINDIINDGGNEVINYRVVKVNLRTGEKKLITPEVNFELTQYDAEMLLLDILTCEFKRISVYRCFHLMFGLVYGEHIIDLFTEALNKLNCSKRFIDSIRDILTNARLESSIRDSLCNWLDMPSKSICQSHRLITLLTTNEKELKEMTVKFAGEEEKIQKMTPDELFE